MKKNITAPSGVTDSGKPRRPLTCLVRVHLTAAAAKLGIDVENIFDYVNIEVYGGTSTVANHIYPADPEAARAAVTRLSNYRHTRNGGDPALPIPDHKTGSAYVKREVRRNK